MAKQFGMLLDLNRCTGCNACIVACKQENDLPPKLDALPGSKGFSFIRVESVGPEGEYPDLSMHYQPMTCMHCAEPPCLEACPEEAIYRNPDGPVLIEKESCTACEACLEVCPYDALSMDIEQEVARKCNLCVQRIAQGHQPACASACNTGAMMFGNLADAKEDISRVIKENQDDCFILKPESQTDPSIYYLKFRKKG